MMGSDWRATEETAPWLQALAQSAWFSVLVWQDEQLVFANPAAARLTGREQDELLGAKPEHIVHPNDLDLLYLNELSSDRRTATRKPFELRIVRPNGEFRWVAVTVERLRSDDTTSTLVTAVDITGRRIVQAALARRLELENALSEISQHFLQLPPEDFDRGIDWTLERLASVAGADRAYLFQYSDDGSTMANTHEWCAEGITPEIENLKEVPIADYPWQRRLFERGKTLHVPLVSKMPKAARAEREEFEREGIQSLIVVPFTFGDRLRGLVGFDAVTEARQWDEEDRHALKMGGEILGSAIQRHEALLELQASRERLELALKAGRGVTWQWEPESDKMAFSGHACELFRIAPEGLPGSSDELFSLIPEEDRELISNKIRNAFKLKQIYQAEHRLVQPDGESVWLSVSGQPTWDAEGRVTRVMGVSADITERKRAEQELIEEKERAQVTLRCIADGMIRTDADGTIDFINTAAERLTGVNLEQAVGKGVDKVFMLTDEETGEPMSNPVEICLSESRVVDFSEPSILRRSDGSELAVRASAAPIPGGNGEIVGVVLVFRDVTRIRDLQRETEFLATHDPLTGLINRREFARVLEDAVSSSTCSGSNHALCYLDLDDFKVVNDTGGHAAGDEMLQELSGVIAATVGDGGTVARLGGDEFGILLNDCSIDEAARRAQRLLDSIRGYSFSWQDHSFSVGASLGIAPIAGGGQTLNELMSAADSACYTAKNRGRNQIHVIIAGPTG